MLQNDKGKFLKNWKKKNLSPVEHWSIAQKLWQAVAQKLYDIKIFVNIKSSSFWLGNRMLPYGEH